jgi:type I restriction enzyme S subunit
VKELPQGWVGAAIGEFVTSIDAGKNVRCVERPPLAHEIGVVKVSAVSWGKFDPEASKILPAEYKPSPHTRIRKDDFLFSRANTIDLVGACVLVDVDPGNLYLSDKILRLNLLNQEKLWLLWFLRSPVGRRALEAASSGNQYSMRNISQSNFLNIEMLVAPLAEQRRIVAKLETLSARSKRARAELDRLSGLVARAKQAILVAAMTGELTADWRVGRALESAESLVSRVRTPQQSRGGREATQDVKPGVVALSVNNPGTALPERWTWVPLRRIARQETGHTPSRSHPEYWDGGIPWIGIRDANAHHGREIHETSQTVSEQGLANSSARLLPAGTVCLSRTASVGYVTMMGRPMATSQDFATWTCTAALHPKYLMYALIAEGDDIRNFGEGSTHTTIYFPEIRAFNIALAPFEEQEEIVKRIETAFVKLDRLTAQTRSAVRLLDRLEQVILAKAFRGELVPQNPSDEPASVLLDRIRAGRVAPVKPPAHRRRLPRMSAAPR